MGGLKYIITVTYNCFMIYKKCNISFVDYDDRDINNFIWPDDFPGTDWCIDKQEE